VKRTVNLIPEEYYERRRLRLRLAAWGAALLIALPALLGLYLWERGQCAGLQRRLAELAAQSERRQQLALRVGELRQVLGGLQAREAAVRSALGRQTGARLLAELDRALEQGVWITSLELDRGGRPQGRSEAGRGATSPPAGQGGAVPFRLRGYAPTNGVLARLLPRLGGMATLGPARLIYTKAVSVGSRPAVEFEIEAELRCG